MLWLKALLFTVVIPGTVAVYLPLLLVGETPPGPAAAPLAALPLFALGLAIYLWCVVDFVAAGRGTPLPLDAPKRLVIRGLYRLSRNPMYVGVLTVIAGWAVYHGNLPVLLYGAVVLGVFHLFVTRYEEPHLRATFGEEYAAYCRRVGRWLPRRLRRD